MDLSSFLTNLPTGNISVVQVVANLLVALILSLITAFVYRKTHSGFAYSRSYNTSMIIVSMVVTMMMMVIANYLALSLGLIGALSVIRFRTAIKDTKDMSYLFICIAIGLASSTGNYAIAVIGTMVINTTLFVLHFVRFDSGLNPDYVVTFHILTKNNESSYVAEKMSEIFSRSSFRSFCEITDEVSEFVYSVHLGKLAEEEATVRLKSSAPKLFNVSIIAPEAGLEV